MSSIIEKIRLAQVPEKYRREYAGSPVGGIIGLLENATESIQPLIELLSSQETFSMIDDGHLTVAMIKPRLDKHLDRAKAKVSFSGDAELTDFVTGLIKPPLEPVLSISLKMTEKDLNIFYAGEPKKRMLISPGNTPNRNRWEDFREMMKSGPLTFILLYSHDGKAIQEWREQMGTSWDVDKIKREEPHALRALALSNDNNMLHGSDSPESVKRELNFLINSLK